MTILKVVTVNLLSDISHWNERGPLLHQDLAELDPDLLAIQEVNLSLNTALWLAERLNYPYSLLTPKSGFERKHEAIAILSRLPFEKQAFLELKGQNRVAQYVQVCLDECKLIFANTHLYWQPGESKARLHQAEQLLEWLRAIPNDPAIILCGDFNATPETSTPTRIRQEFTSAYAAIHGREPEYTCPTPLPRSFSSQLRTFLGFFFLIRPKHLKLNWRGTLDYIYISSHIKVEDCQVVLNQPSPENPNLYPSDHFGLFARLEI